MTDRDVAPSWLAGRIRLECCCCFREDFDGVDEIPPDWQDVEEVRSFEESIAAPVRRTPIACEVDMVGERYGDDAYEWSTHRGVCPDCRAENAETAATPEPATGRLF